MIRHVKDDLYQIGEHVAGGYGREAVNVYVLLNGDAPILIDCGSHLHNTSIMAEMDEVLDGRTPEYIFLTHSELPHAGNIASVAEKWPGIKVIVSNVMLPYIEVLPVLPLSQITQVVPGHKIECGSRTIYFIDALLKDQPGSQWVYDDRTESIFTGDGFGYYTTDEQIDQFSDEIEGGIQADQFVAYHKTTFHYLRWIKPDRFNADLDTMFSRRPISVIAPIHGNAIRSDIPTHVARMKSAIETIYQRYEAVNSPFVGKFASSNGRVKNLNLPTTEATVYGAGLERVAIRPITDKIFWLTHCLGDLADEYYKEYFATLPDADNYSGGRIVDYPFSAFLIVDEKSLLIDTCGPKQREAFMKALEHGLGGRSLDYIWISHIELPHAGNAPTIKRKYPGSQIVTRAGGENYELHGLENGMNVAPGDMLDLGYHKIEMVDPLFVDHGLSQWLFDHTTGFMFTADWGHNLHEPALGHCFKYVEEMLATGYDDATMVDDIKVNAWYQFPWLAWTDADEIAGAVDEFFQMYDVKIFAPSHGNIIRRDFDKYIPMIKEGMRLAAAMPFSHAL